MRGAGILLGHAQALPIVISPVPTIFLRLAPAVYCDIAPEHRTILDDSPTKLHWRTIHKGPRLGSNVLNGDVSGFAHPHSAFYSIRACREPAYSGLSPGVLTPDNLAETYA